jgi:hypothetical protein
MVYCALAMRIDQFSREKRRKMLLTSEGLIGKRRGCTALNLRNGRMRAFRGIANRNEALERGELFFEDFLCVFS